MVNTKLVILLCALVAATIAVVDHRAGNSLGGKDAKDTKTTAAHADVGKGAAATRQTSSHGKSFTAPGYTEPASSRTGTPHPSREEVRSAILFFLTSYLRTTLPAYQGNNTYVVFHFTG